MKAEAEELLSKIEAKEDELLSLRKEVLAVVQKILVTVEEDRSELQSVGEVVATAAAIEEDEVAAQQKEANTSEMDDVSGKGIVMFESSAPGELESA
ncbi:hypothetical protein FOZ62_013031 [Perkinsus olseni]|uniref:Uncharacterized protein n=1 Tax=Perkinsus olseni TaxID=32597 RepID=A0A7J6PDE1_PEROL|nr:hypothetical protein FOZ62_013031 [Perkinsus olseni]